jgi:glyoxylase-like metal-dependent hydrolase (beta-lactamase superfamily II)
VTGAASHTWVEVGDRVFVRRYAFFDQSIGAVVGQAGVVVIDTRTTHAQADELRKDLRLLTDAPLAAVVNTHHHYDHTFGNARFAEVPIWGHEACAATLSQRGEAMRQRVMASLPELAEELAEVAITPPDHTFGQSATVELGDRSVELRHLGRGHTDNDLVVLVPDAGVVFAGDLLENRAPPSFGDAFPIAWAETVGASLLPIIGEVVVPGHGDPAGRDFAERQAGELALLARLIQSAVAGAIGMDQAMRESPFPAETTRVALDRGHLELERPGS